MRENELSRIILTAYFIFVAFFVGVGIYLAASDPDCLDRDEWKEKRGKKMSSRSINKVFLIGNLTRDPELRVTPQGTSVCTMGLATNREWTTSENTKRDEPEFHSLVAWHKLAEICEKFLRKGSKIYVEGRLQTREWEKDGIKNYRTEVVLSEMIVLDSKKEEDEIELPEVDFDGDFTDEFAEAIDV